MSEFDTLGRWDEATPRRSGRRKFSPLRGNDILNSVSNTISSLRRQGGVISVGLALLFGALVLIPVLKSFASQFEHWVIGRAVSDCMFSADIGTFGTMSGSQHEAIYERLNDSYDRQYARQYRNNAGIGRHVSVGVLWWIGLIGIAIGLGCIGAALLIQGGYWLNVIGIAALIISLGCCVAGGNALILGWPSLRIWL